MSACVPSSRNCSIANVNTWLQSDGDRRMIRTLDGQLRAMLSDRYRRLDNFDLPENVLPILQRLEGARFESEELINTKMYLKSSRSRRARCRPGRHRAGRHRITNSEVGCGKLSVQRLIFRLVYRNGLSHGGARYGNPKKSDITDEEALYRMDRIAAFIRYMAWMYQRQP